VFDASGIDSSSSLRDLWAFFHPAIRRVLQSGRVIVLGTPPEDCGTPGAAIAQRALEGFVRSVGKEVRRGATAQLLCVSPGAEDHIESTLRFFLSPKSAFVSGQIVRIGLSKLAADRIDWGRPLTGNVALVTGASRGIGEAIAEVLARDGAHVVGVDVPAQSDDLARVTGRLGGSSLTVDITDDGAPGAIAGHLLDAHGGLDVVVHNAGVHRDGDDRGDADPHARGRPPDEQPRPRGVPGRRRRDDRVVSFPFPAIGLVHVDPRPFAQRAAVRLPLGDRPRDVDEGPLPGGDAVGAA
jgi:3-oxoacyl-[acyl-carrier protein] reductase